MTNDNNDYAELFREQIRSGIDYIKSQIEKAVTPLPLDVKDDAVGLLPLALELPDVWTTTRSVLLGMAPRMEQSGSADGWTSCLQLGARSAQQQEDVEVEAEMHLHLGVVQRLQGQFDEATYHAERSLSLFREAGLHQKEAASLNELAFIYRRQRQLARADDLLTQAMTVAPAGTSEMAYGKLLSGAIALQRGDLEKSQAAVMDALQIYEQLDDQRLIAWTKTNLGVVEEKLKNFEMARQLHQTAIATLEAVADPVHLATARMNLGNAHLRLDESEEALECYQYAKTTFREHQEVVRLAFVEHNIGMANGGLGNYDLAISSFHSAIEQYRNLNDDFHIANSLDELGVVYLKMHEAETALETFEQALRHLEKVDDDGARTKLECEIREHIVEARKA